MMRRICLFLLIALLPGCAHLGFLQPNSRHRARLWDEAHQALMAQNFALASARFEEIAREFPGSTAGRESLFYLGTIRLDPRNPDWDPKPAEEHLATYLAADSTDPGSIHRRPEAETLFQLAQQLNMPPEARIPELQPETKVVTRVERVPQRVVRYRESRALAAQVQRLEKELAERNALIQQQKEELERIRKTLTGKRQ